MNKYKSLCVCFGLVLVNLGCNSSTETAPPAVPPTSTPIPVSNTPAAIIPAEKQPAPAVAPDAPVKAQNPPTGKPTAPAKPGPTVKLTDGLEYTDENVGNGPMPQSGQQVLVHYIGTLKDGTKFDSSLDRNEPFAFTVGGGTVIKGWDEGIRTMKLGGTRKLVVPPSLGYGAQAQGKIPPNSTLYFEIALIAIQ